MALVTLQIIHLREALLDTNLNQAVMEVRAINVRSLVTGQISVLMELQAEDLAANMEEVNTVVVMEVVPMAVATVADKPMVKVEGNMAVQEEALKEKTTVKSALTVKEVATGQEIVPNQGNNKVAVATKGRSFDLRFANNLR